MLDFTNLKSGDVVECISTPTVVSRAVWTLGKRYTVQHDQLGLYVVNDISGYVRPNSSQASTTKAAFKLMRGFTAQYQQPPAQPKYVMDGALEDVLRICHGGEQLECIKCGSSIASYTLGVLYHVQQDSDGDLYIEDDDGDPVYASSSIFALLTQAHIQAQPPQYRLEAALDKCNAGDVIKCSHAASIRYSEGAEYLIKLDAHGAKCIVNDKGEEAYHSLSKFVIVSQHNTSADEQDTWGIGREYRAPRKEWTPDVPDPSVDLMKSIRDACNGK